MESHDSFLSQRQLDVVRKNLLSVFRFAVKALIDKACFCAVDDGCEEFINFSAAVEHVLQHRLRPSKTWYLGDDRSHFWFYIKSACRRRDLRSCITNIDNIENIKSPVAKGRAFLRCALMEKRLAEYLGEALKQSNITKRYYQPGAIMLGEEATELCGVLLGLNSIDFGFCLKGENYDTVECPLSVSYTRFMKFKQSQESLHSDLEEMRELSCGSSLASEDGQDAHDTPSSESWSDRYNMLHKRYMRVLEQKSFLEEVTASQEKALQAATAAQQDQYRIQREAAAQKQQYEEVILELQAQVARMKTINESLQQQLVLARSTRLPMSEMAGRRESGGEASRFAAALAYKQDADGHSLTSSYDRGSVGRAGDTRSLTSAVSEISVDVAGAGQGQPEGGTRRGEDTHSMVPLTGSLGDLHLDLDSGSNNAAAESSSTVANPEQSTPVVSVSSGLYTIAFVESTELNGNDSDNIHIRDHVSQDIPYSEASLSREESGRESASQGILYANAQDMSTGGDREGDHTGDPAMDSFPCSEAKAVQVAAVETGGDRVGTGGDGGAVRQQGDQQAAGEEGAEEEEDTDVQGENLQDSIVVLSSPSSQEKEEAAESLTQTSSVSDLKSTQDVNIGQDGSDDQSEDSKTSEPEELLSESNAGEGQTTPSDRDTSEPEVLSQGDMASSKSSAVSSSDKEDVSEPELLVQEGDTGSKEVAVVGEDTEQMFTQDASSLEAATPREDGAGGSEESAVECEVDSGKDGAVTAEQQRSGVAGATEGGAISGSDSGSSDGNKDAWDMLSDAAQDSS